MQDLTVKQLEDLIVLTEEKLLTLRNDEQAHRDAEIMIANLREMRLKKMQEEA